MTYDRAQAAAFYDAYGEREWTRFQAESLELDLGAEPGSREVGNHMLAVLEVGA